MLLFSKKLVTSVPSLNNFIIMEPKRTKEKPTPYVDDIECKSWLEEIGMPQYCETFYANFTSGGTAFLSRKRLAQVRLQDFPHMNITNYEHQKVLIQHIKHTLKYTYQSPIRKQETRQSAYGKIPGISLVSEEKSNVSRRQSKPEVSVVEEKNSDAKEEKLEGQVQTKDEGVKEKKKMAKRRNTFDDKAWEAINKSRSSAGESKSAVEMLREGVTAAPPVIYFKLYIIYF